jgi:hypothetical protein
MVLVIDGCGVDTGVALVQPASGTTVAGIAQSQVLSAALSGSAVPSGFPATALGQQLQQIAQTISVQSKLGVNRQIFSTLWADSTLTVARSPSSKACLRNSVQP